MKKHIIIPTLACVLLFSGSLLHASDGDKKQPPEQSQVYGSQLMSKQERIEHRNKIQNAKTAKEREKIRHEHHQLMKARAKKQGVELPDKPASMGHHREMGPGKGMRAKDGMGAGRGYGGERDR